MFLLSYSMVQVVEMGKNPLDLLKSRVVGRELPHFDNPGGARKAKSRGVLD